MIHKHAILFSIQFCELHNTAQSQQASRMMSDVNHRTQVETESVGYGIEESSLFLIMDEPYGPPSYMFLKFK